MLPSPSPKHHQPPQLLLQMMFVRCKRVTDPLDDRVKASIICGCCGKYNSSTTAASSSGSEQHCLSPCLSHLIHEFIQDQDSSNGGADTDPDVSCTQQEDQFSLLEIKERVKKILSLSVNTDQYTTILSSHVSMAMEISDSLRSSGKSIFMRKIASVLRELGHNAGVCKTRWEKTGSLTAGSYEFIDVVADNRYFIDVDFVSEFEIVRPTSEYKSLLKVLPKAYIGKREELEKVIKLMCDASKKSLKSRDLHLSPWRKNRFMQLKWFGPHRRTLNPVPSSSSVSVSTPVRCRAVGFDAVSVVPAATRT